MSTSRPDFLYTDAFMHPAWEKIFEPVSDIEPRLVAAQALQGKTPLHCMLVIVRATKLKILSNGQAVHSLVHDAEDNPLYDVVRIGEVLQHTRSQTKILPAFVKLPQRSSKPRTLESAKAIAAKYLQGMAASGLVELDEEGTRRLVLASLESGACNRVTEQALGAILATRETLPTMTLRGLVTSVTTARIGSPVSTPK